MIGFVDGNNSYVLCERVVNPELILSGTDPGVSALATFENIPQLILILALTACARDGVYVL